MTIENTLDAEVLVIGAGPGGSAAASRLSQAGHEVLLIDKADFPRDKICGDGLSPLAVDRLAEMGILDQVEQAGANRIEDISVTGPDGLRVEAHFADFLTTTHPYSLVMPRLQFDEIIRQYALSSGVTYRARVNVKQINMDRDRIVGVMAQTPGGPLEIRTKHVVLAVGANMGLMRRSGHLKGDISLARASRAYYTVGTLAHASYDFYYEKSLMPGYGWVFPTGNRQANIGLGTFGARNVASSAVEEFIDLLEERGVIKAPQIVNKLGSFPLRTDYPSQRVAGVNWLLVGEAAGLVNPVSGEGIDLALESGLIAGDVLSKSIRTGQPFAQQYHAQIQARYRTLFRSMNLMRMIVIRPAILKRLLRSMDRNEAYFHTFLAVAMGLEPAHHLLKPGHLLQALR